MDTLRRPLYTARRAMVYNVILNPAAGVRRAGREAEQVAAAFRNAGVAFEMHTTNAPGHASEIARKVAAPGTTIVIAGGDGTVKEVVEGLVGLDVETAVLPLGTGNDFAQLLGMPRGIEAGVQALLHAAPLALDIGRVRWVDGDGGTGEAHFANAVGIGFDALVAHEAERTKWLRGISGYLVAVVRSLRLWPRPRVEISFPDDTHPLIQTPLMLMAVSNGVTVGGGFRLTPDALPADGLLDVCLASGMGHGRALAVLPKAMQGKHLDEPEVSMYRCARIRIASEEPLPIHLDGEVPTLAAREIEAEVVPGALRVRAPRGSFDSLS